MIDEIGMVFDEQLDQDVDVVFLCSGHGKSKGIIESGVISEKAKIIDLSSDFRLKFEGNEFVYGLPELNRDLIKEAEKVANPGCFATCIQLCLLPLASTNLLNNDIHVSAITGSTGAGQTQHQLPILAGEATMRQCIKPLRISIWTRSRKV